MKRAKKIAPARALRATDKKLDELLSRRLFVTIKALESAAAAPFVQLRKEVDVKFSELSQRLSNTIASLERLQSAVSENFEKSDCDRDEILERLRGICIPEVQETSAFMEMAARVANLEKSAPPRSFLPNSYAPPAGGVPPTRGLWIRGGWINIYKVNSDGAFDIDTADGPYVDRSSATLNAGMGRIACIEMKSFEKGEGLDHVRA